MADHFATSSISHLGPAQLWIQLLWMVLVLNSVFMFYRFHPRKAYFHLFPYFLLAYNRQLYISLSNSICFMDVHILRPN